MARRETNPSQSREAGNRPAVRWLRPQFFDVRRAGGDDAGAGHGETDNGKISRQLPGLQSQDVQPNLSPTTCSRSVVRRMSEREETEQGLSI